MVALRCKKHQHRIGPKLCPECEELSDYAAFRLERCPFGSGKPTCATCEIHCYRAPFRERMREVMRESGPRMLLRHPILAILHLIDSRRPPPVRTGPPGCHPAR
ncbi:MAG: nitrous oxide-stimulated promoter family protein [Thermoanaerobaculia bacterium]